MQYFLDLAKRVLDGHSPSPAEQKRLADLPCSQISRLFPGSAVLRRNFSGSTISVCSITNAKSGRCSEDCAFCAQSARYLSRAQYYPLKDPLELADMGKRNAAMGVERFSLVTSGRGLSPDEVQKAATAVQDMAASGVHACASLGVLAKEQLDLLKRPALKGITTIWRQHRVFSPGSAPPMIFHCVSILSGRPGRPDFQSAAEPCSGWAKATHMCWSWPWY